MIIFLLLENMEENKIISEPKFWELSNKDIAKIMQEHGFRTLEKDSNIYGYIPFINVNTKETGEEETNLTGYDLEELKEYLGY